MTFHDRWIAAQSAEDAARREHASALMSGVGITLFLALVFVAAGLAGGSF